MRKWFAYVLLLLMAIVNTPREYWHECDHLEVVIADNDEHTVQKKERCGICSFVFSAQSCLSAPAELSSFEVLMRYAVVEVNQPFSSGLDDKRGRAPPVVA